ncbi:MAG: hypothetical protein GQ538_09010 [Xanthomonadales bacterium]|nr:hypothetical protein [Xanthomonadales bacterium]
MKFHQWHHDCALTLLLPAMDDSIAGELLKGVAMMFNATDSVLNFSLPSISKTGKWKLEFCSAVPGENLPGTDGWNIGSRAIACAIYSNDVTNTK